MDMLGYYVAHKRAGKMLWLADDEKTWTAEFSDAAEFTSAELAKAIAEREAAKDDIPYVFGLLHS